jgi:hypothetical protein
MSEVNRIDEALRLLAEETARAEASPRVRTVLLAEIRRRRMRQAGPWWMAAAAALLIGIAIGVWSRSDRPQDPRGQVAARTLEAPPALELPGITPEAPPAMPAAPAASARRVARAPQIPAARLAATPWMLNQSLPPVRNGQVLRLPVSPELARQFGVPEQSGEWRAEIFVGDDGLARAFRLVRVPAYR